MRSEFSIVSEMALRPGLQQVPALEFERPSGHLHKCAAVRRYYARFSQLQGRKFGPISALRHRLLPLDGRQLCEYPISLQILARKARISRRSSMELQSNPKSVVHFMLYSGPGNTDSVLRSEPDEAYMLSSLQRLLDDPYFQIIEITHIKSARLRKKVAEAFKKVKKQPTFGCQP